MKTNFRFEKTAYGWKAYKKQGNAFIYFGHFYTKKEAKAAAINEFTDIILITLEHKIPYVIKKVIQQNKHT